MTTAVTSIADELGRRSVTRYDSVMRQVGRDERQPMPGAISLTFPAARPSTITALPIDLPLRWSRQRDYILAATPDHNDMWGSAVGRAITKQVARGWEVEDTAQSEVRVKRAQRLLQLANKGKGWAHFLGQHLLDYLTTDNGAFIEVLWSTPYLYRDGDGRLRPVGQVLSIQHLDSLRCTRLLDDDLIPYRASICERWPMIRPEEVTAELFPVLYTDLAGRGHVLFRWQVVDVVDMPSGRVEHRGAGLCAASRSYRTIHTTTGLERYLDEKITGERVLEIHLVNGIHAGQMEQALQAAAEQQRARGLRQFRGVVVIPAQKMDATIGGYRIPIAEVPDGFTPREEREEARIKFANALGIPVRDLQPAPAGLNSGATALVEAERAEGGGLAAWATAFAAALNDWVLPPTVVFRWQENTLRDERDQAEVRKLRAETRKVQVDVGEITPQQALQLAADEGDVPEEFLPDDATPQDKLAGDEKPLAGQAQRQAAAADADGDGQLTLRELWARKAVVVESPEVWDHYTLNALNDAAREVALALKARRVTVAEVDAVGEVADDWARRALAEGE
jgi:hypothetical protein